MRKLILLSALFIPAILTITNYNWMKRVVIHFKQNYFSNKNDSNCPNCYEYFQDGISTHADAYKKSRLTPRKNFQELDNLVLSGKLTEMTSCERYTVAPMNNSRPYLLPEGKLFVEGLATAYKMKCEEKGIDYEPFVITSATRTTESVKALRKINKNAINNSAHLHGRTLDVSYLWNSNKHIQKKCLIAALKEMRDEGLCYVKYEDNQHCLHITAR